MTKTNIAYVILASAIITTVVLAITPAGKAAAANAGSELCTALFGSSSCPTTQTPVLATLTSSSQSTINANTNSAVSGAISAINGHTDTAANGETITINGHTDTVANGETITINNHTDTATSDETSKVVGLLSTTPKYINTGQTFFSSALAPGSCAPPLVIADKGRTMIGTLKITFDPAGSGSQIALRVSPDGVNFLDLKIQNPPDSIDEEYDVPFTGKALEVCNIGSGTANDNGFVLQGSAIQLPSS